VKLIYDFIIIGGGILGASTAMQLKERHPDNSILLIEKENVLENIKLVILVASYMQVFTTSLAL
jgi:thioredoxin reductase